MQMSAVGGQQPILEVVQSLVLPLQEVVEEIVHARLVVRSLLSSGFEQMPVAERRMRLQLALEESRGTPRLVELEHRH